MYLINNINYNISSFLSMYEHLYIFLLNTFMKMIISLNITIQIISLVSSSFALVFCLKSDEDKFKKYTNINLFLLSVNYIAFTNIKNLIAHCVDIQQKISVISYVFVIFFYSFVSYLFVFFMSYFTILTIRENMYEFKRYLDSKEK
jgi:hypothetical protein